MILDKMILNRLFTVAVLMLPLVSGAENLRRSITLDEAITIARAQSVDAAVALNELKTAYWEYRTFRADLLPEINFQATAPSYRKSYSPYQLDDGSYTFVRNNFMQMSGTVSVDQNIWLTGGTLSLNTSLDFLKQLEGNKYNRFMSVPVALTLSQPIFGVNHIKWNRRIEPVRYEEAKARFMSATEQVAMSTINYFFNLLMSKENLSIARQNLKNADKLYEVAKAKRFMSATEQVAMSTINYFFNLLMSKENLSIARQNLKNADKLYEVAKAKRAMGQISENDLLQLELNKLNAVSSLTNCESQFKSDMFKLRSFLSLDETVELEPVIPADIPKAIVGYDDVLDKALANNSFAKNIRRRQLEADYEVAKAKGNMREITLYAQIGYTGTADKFGPAYDRLKDNQVVEVGFRIYEVAKAKGNMREITLYAQIGYTGTADKFGPAYDRLKDNQVVEVGFRIPLLDWGKRRGKVKVAESNRDVVESRLRQETMNFNQDIFILVERFNNQQQQLDISITADNIAQKRYDTNVETFLIGKISTLDLNDSQSKKDASRQDYINQLYAYWHYYYQLRSLTLWDFSSGKSIDADIEAIIRQ